MRRTLLLTLGLGLVACNRPPSEPVIRIEPEDPVTTDDIWLVLVSESVDPDGDDIGHKVSWTLNGADQGDRDGKYDIPARLTEKGQVWEVTVIGWDGLDEAEPVTASVTVRNSLPLAEVRIEPIGPGAGDDLVAVVETSDADGDTVTVSYTWARDGSTTGETGDTLSADVTQKGETWAVRVTPNDGEADGPVAADDVIIGNVVPSVAAARVDPATLRTTTTASCIGAGWDDPDGDPETYRTEWLVDDELVAESETLDGLVFFDRGDRVACRLTPIDDSSEGDPVTSFAVTVKNTFPVMSDLVVEPDPPRTLDTIEVTPTMYDADGDTVVALYRWFVDGDEVSDASFLRGTDDFDKGQVVELQVRPYDGIDIQGPSLWSATVENTPPTAPTLSISPAMPTASDDLECVIDADSVDDDGDSVTYAWAWYVNGTNQGGTSTLSASLTSSGDTVQCDVTPNDGEDDGPAGTVSVTLP